MCLSAAVSFTASFFLWASGAPITGTAWRRNLRYLPLALMPLFAGIQQFSEGFVGLGTTGHKPMRVFFGAMGFMSLHGSP